MNNELVDVLTGTGDKILTKTKGAKNKSNRRKGNTMKKKSPWFDSDCINSKRNLNRLASSYGRFPKNVALRENYYSARRDHKKLSRTKKTKFFHAMNQDIEDGSKINWSMFKKLKSVKENPL